ncbi:MAG: hypothetical protein AAFW70_26430 [Cyanobacteria bacterium J06635_10]
MLDAIASHQTKKLLSNPKLREFQIWHLQVKENSVTHIDGIAMNVTNVGKNI